MGSSFDFTASGKFCQCSHGGTASGTAVTGSARATVAFKFKLALAVPVPVASLNLAFVCVCHWQLRVCQWLTQPPCQCAACVPVIHRHWHIPLLVHYRCAAVKLSAITARITPLLMIQYFGSSRALAPAAQARGFHDQPSSTEALRVPPSAHRYIVAWNTALWRAMRGPSSMYCALVWQTR